MLGFFLAATAVLLLVFLVVFRFYKASTLTGFLFLLVLLSAGVSYLVFVANSGIPWLNYTLLAMGAVLVLALAFGLYVAIALLLWNARLVLKRERRSLGNSLTLLLAIGLIAFAVISAVLSRVQAPLWVSTLWSGILLVIFFYFLHIFLFLTSALLCALARPAKKQDFIIVLGSGLVEGKVPPLLAGRIDRAIAFYHRQQKKRTPPKLVMSGGQGPDEPVAESAAMRAYALEQGIPAGDILVEGQSANTDQNMRFSKKVMGAAVEGKPYRCIYATSNYHLLRAGIYARRAGLRIDGIGARTALYYLPNALLREYIAFFAMHKKPFIIIVVLAFLLGCLMNLTPWLLSRFIV